MDIRLAREDDVAAIQCLYDEGTPALIPGALRAVRDHHVRVAESDNGSVIGFQVLTRGYAVWVAVAAEHRRQGIGSLLMQDALEQAAELGFPELIAQIDERNLSGSTFCEHFQLKPFLHAVNLSLNLADWDETVLILKLTQARAAGIRFGTYAEFGDTFANREHLYALNKALSATIPRDQPQEFVSYETYVERRLSSKTMPHEGIFIALEGDRWVGMTQVNLEENFAFIQMTGVLPECRGRGIAQALKLLSIRFAAQHERQIIRTFNDVTNPAMIAVNEKAGFCQEQRFYRMRRKPVMSLASGV